MRMNLVVLFAAALTGGCAGPGIVDGRSDELPSCGPKVSKNSVRSLKLLDEYATLGREATLRIAEERLGPIELLDGGVSTGYWYSRINATAAAMGCDVVIHVGRTPAMGEKARNREYYHVILARRVPDE